MLGKIYFAWLTMCVALNIMFLTVFKNYLPTGSIKIIYKEGKNFLELGGFRQVGLDGDKPKIFLIQLYHKTRICIDFLQSEQ